MRNNIILKLFVFCFMFILFSLQAFADSSEVNTLSKIIVDRLDDNVFGINIFFDAKYDNNAFVQQKDTGSYYVFIPDTAMSKRKTAVIYKNSRDKSKIKVSVEQKPFLKDEVKSSYIRLSVDVAPDYSIKILSSTMDKFSDYNSSHSFFNLTTFFALLLIFSGIFILLKIVMMSKTYKDTQSYTAYPAGYINYDDNNSLSVPKDADSAMSIPKLPLRNNLKASDAKSFSCFDILGGKDGKISISDYKSVMAKTASNVKEKNSKQTNPINRNFIEDGSEFVLPAVEDINKKEKEQAKNEPELLSVLNLAPNKGFYLTTVEDAFGLFGFVNDNVFLLKKFNDLSQINLQARFYDRNIDKDVYIVRMDSYKAMVEISDSAVQELAVL